MRLVGSNVGPGKSIVDGVPVPLLALLHFVIAMALLWPLVRVSRLRHVKRDEWFNLLLQALFGTFGFTLPMLGGVQRTSAVAAGGITSTIPVVVALLSWPILKERPNGRALASIALAIVGVVVINLAHVDQSAGGETSFTGNAAGGVVSPEASTREPQFATRAACRAPPTCPPQRSKFTRRCTIARLTRAFPASLGRAPRRLRLVCVPDPRAC